MSKVSDAMQLLLVLGNELSKSPMEKMVESIIEHIEATIFKIINEEINDLKDVAPYAEYGFLTPFTIQVRLASKFKMKGVPLFVIKDALRHYEERRRLNDDLCVKCGEPLTLEEIDLRTGICIYCVPWEQIRVFGKGVYHGSTERVLATAGEQISAEDERVGVAEDEQTGGGEDSPHENAEGSIGVDQVS